MRRSPRRLRRPSGAGVQRPGQQQFCDLAGRSEAARPKFVWRAVPCRAGLKPAIELAERGHGVARIVAE